MQSFGNFFRVCSSKCNIDDCAGTVFRLRTRIPDIDFIRGFAGHLVRIGAPDEDAAVGFRLDPEFHPELEVGVIAIGHKKAVAVVGDDRNRVDLPPSRRRLDVSVQLVELFGYQRNSPGENHLVLVGLLIIIRTDQIRRQKRKRLSAYLPLACRFYR